MKEIKSNKDKYIILLDEQDYENLKSYSFVVDIIRKIPYVRIFKNGIRVSLNQALFGRVTKRIKHKDNNPLNFCRDNLEVMLKSQNKKQYRADYYLNNRKEILKNSCLWAKNNKDKINERNRRWRKTEKGKKARKTRERRLKNRYRIAVKMTKKRNIEFHITFKDWSTLINKPCFYCNTSLLPFMGVGLDRKDNNLNYTIDNVLPCCGTCNRIRFDTFTIEETQAMVNALIEYRKGKDPDIFKMGE